MFDASKIIGSGFNHHLKNSSLKKKKSGTFTWWNQIADFERWLKHEAFSSVVFMERCDRRCRKHSVQLPGQWHHHCYFNLRLTKILSKIASFTQDLQMSLEQGNHSFSFPLTTSRLKIRGKIVVDLQLSSTVDAVGIQLSLLRISWTVLFFPKQMIPHCYNRWKREH